MMSLMTMMSEVCHRSVVWCGLSWETFPVLLEAVSYKPYLCQIHTQLATRNLHFTNSSPSCLHEALW